MDIQFHTDEEGRPMEIISIDLVKEDKLIHDWFRIKIREIKVKRLIAIKRKNKVAYYKALEDLYSVMGQKDSWLRKFMQERGLYLKEVEFNPSNAMWGG
jgi:hemerythrin